MSRSGRHEVVTYKVKGGDVVERMLRGWSTILQENKPIVIKTGLSEEEAARLAKTRREQLRLSGNLKGTRVEARLNFWSPEYMDEARID